MKISKLTNIVVKASEFKDELNKNNVDYEIFKNNWEEIINKRYKI